MTLSVSRDVGCGIHRAHDPEPTYLEVHHVVPQAWQATWKPDGPGPDPGPSPDRPELDLWDSRTVVVCRTGHGNIHHWIVAMMHAAHDLGIDDVARLMHEVRSGLVHHMPGVDDFSCAAQALIRWQEVGGELGTLIAAREWGAI